MGKKFKVDRPLSDYGDEIDKMVNEIKNGAPILSRLPDDMTENSCAETAFRLALSQAGETDEAHIKVRRIKNDVLNSGKLSFKLSAGDHFSAIAIVHYVDKFRKCFAAIEGGDRNENAVIGAIEAAFTLGALSPPANGVRRRLKKAETEAARVAKIKIAETREEEIANAFRKVAERDKLPLKAGEKYINIHFRSKLGDFLPEGFTLPSSRELRDIVSKIKKGQL